MILELSRNEKSLFEELIQVRRHKSSYQFIKTIEECSELQKGITKYLNNLEDRTTINKAIGNLNDMVDEIVDVQIQLFLLKMEIVRQIGEAKFEMLWNSKYVTKMQQIRKKIDELKQDKES
ncbi:MAG: hypothetical protein QXG00_04080 [Candidatus Woesearchaeota archaeon]